MLRVGPYPQAPLHTTVTRDRFGILTKTGRVPVPTKLPGQSRWACPTNSRGFTHRVCMQVCSPITMATTLSDLATLSAGWAKRQRPWVWTFTQESQQQRWVGQAGTSCHKCGHGALLEESCRFCVHRSCSMMMAASRVLPPATWALPKMAHRRWVCSRSAWHHWAVPFLPLSPPQDVFARGMELHAKVTLLAEGCHGSLGKSVMRQFALREHCQHQSYAIGLKEVGVTVRAVPLPLPDRTMSPSVLVCSCRIWSPTPPLPVGVGD